MSAPPQQRRGMSLPQHQALGRAPQVIQLHALGIGQGASLVARKQFVVLGNLGCGLMQLNDFP
jgi:hypothetical protein